MSPPLSPSAALAEPPPDCPLCPRLVAYRDQNRAEHPDWFNGATPSFGDPDARLLIVGLAPGRSGANRTGRPFTGDFAGVLLFQTLLDCGLARGRYAASPDDSLELVDCMITNAVRCAPPGNRPDAVEESNCRPYLAGRLAGLPRLQVIVTLGDVARRNTLRALGERGSAAGPGHGSEMTVGGLHLINSYHCSRLNTNTGRLTPDMFSAVFRRARALLS